MRLTRITFSFLLAAGLISCGSDEKEVDKNKKVESEDKKLTDSELNSMLDELNSETEEILEDGYHEIKYPSGKLKQEGTISGGRKEGLWTHYRETGEKWSECNFTNGEPNGKVVSYHPNGQVNYIGYFTNGIKSGIWMFYDTEGKLVKEAKMTK